MKTEFEIWRDERNGVKERSGWWLVAAGLILVGSFGALMNWWG